MTTETKSFSKLHLILAVVALVLMSGGGCSKAPASTPLGSAPSATPDASSSSSPAAGSSQPTPASSPQPTPVANSSPQPTALPPIGIKLNPVGLLPAQSPVIVGIGLDKFLWTRAALNGPWIQVPNSCCVTGITVIADRSMLGIGQDKNVWTRATLSSPWVQVPNSCCIVNGLGVMADGAIVGTGEDGFMYKRATVNSPWAKIPESWGLIGLTVMPDRRLLVVDVFERVGILSALPGKGSEIPNSCCVTSATLLANGTIVGVGRDKNLWTRTLTSSWVQVPNSGSVTSIAAWPW